LVNFHRYKYCGGDPSSTLVAKVQTALSKFCESTEH